MTRAGLERYVEAFDNDLGSDPNTVRRVSEFIEENWPGSQFRNPRVAQALEAEFTNLVNSVGDDAPPLSHIDEYINTVSDGIDEGRITEGEDIPYGFIEDLMAVQDRAEGALEIRPPNELPHYVSPDNEIIGMDDLIDLHSMPRFSPTPTGVRAMDEWLREEGMHLGADMNEHVNIIHDLQDTAVSTAHDIIDAASAGPSVSNAPPPGTMPITVLEDEATEEFGELALRHQIEPIQDITNRQE